MFEIGEREKVYIPLSAKENNEEVQRCGVDGRGI